MGPVSAIAWGLAVASAVLVTGYLALAIAISLLQRKLIYRPDPRRSTPEDCGLAGVETLAIDAPDGATIEAWYASAEPGRPTILYFHGNRGYIELRAERLAELKSRGFGVMMPSYRGYGGSSGRPSESNNVADAKLVFGAMLARGIAPEKIVVFGESLGTGIAVQLAAARPIAGLVLDSPYSSMTAVAALRYPWLPVSWLLVDRYVTIDHIVTVTAPLLVLHSGADLLIPPRMGRAVYDAANGPKAIQIFAGAGHLDHVDLGSFDVVSRFIDGLPRFAAHPGDSASTVREKGLGAAPQAYVVAKV